MTNKAQKSRGKPKQYTDEQLKQIALDVKYQLGGAKLTFSVLEKQTGISRNTFQRRINSYITELNTPIVRELEISDKDAVYFPNFEKIYEAFRLDPKRMLSEMRSLEITFYEVFEKLTEANKRIEKVETYKAQIETLQADLKKYKDQAHFYKNLYETTVVNSLYADKRKEMGLEKSIINFKEHVSKHSSLRNMDDMFRESNVSDEDDLEVLNPMTKIKAKYPNLFDDNKPNN
ncbi:hypothetical protein [Paenibacillus peoriae]|uniref:hypothetical protein n=1 Tax=Paenibacillus peoriae TaxID=59893 RepID=UPI00096CAC46|nr:hypothetical protein [Paenibacillus peoriae]OMF77879.1 hypothetical protein BK145_18195 [Paenibacillus peoriae]